MMRSRTGRILMLVAVFALALSATALGANGSGKLKSYTHHAKSKSGTLVLIEKGKSVTYILPDNSVCGYQKGESGGPLPSCRSFGAKKYKGDTVNVRWTRKHGHRVASFASVVIPAPRLGSSGGSAS